MREACADGSVSRDPMDCEKFESALMDELYGELDELTSAAVKRHIAGCARCAALLSGLRTTRRLAALPLVEPPARLEERILRAAVETRPVVPPGRQLARAGAPAARWAIRPGGGGRGAGGDGKGAASRGPRLRGFGTRCCSCRRRRRRTGRYLCAAAASTDLRNGAGRAQPANPLRDSAERLPSRTLRGRVPGIRRGLGERSDRRPLCRAVLAPGKGLPGVARSVRLGRAARTGQLTR